MLMLLSSLSYADSSQQERGQLAEAFRAALSRHRPHLSLETTAAAADDDDYGDYGDDNGNSSNNSIVNGVGHENRNGSMSALFSARASYAEVTMSACPVATAAAAPASHTDGATSPSTHVSSPCAAPLLAADLIPSSDSTESTGSSQPPPTQGEFSFSFSFS
jgi:hypothetical protein